MRPVQAFTSLALVALASTAVAQEDCDEECQALRNSQNPLANVRAIMTDNTIAYGTSKRDDTSYAFQVQPVQSFETEMGFNFIARGIIPIMAIEEGARFPQTGPDRVGGSGNTFGLGDAMAQGFFVPEIEGAKLSFGVGPQISFNTHTDDALSGPGWGGGVAGVVFGFAGNLSYGGVVGHHWGEDGFSLTTIQPIVMYNTEFLGGSYFGYNNSITHDWDADSGNAWQVPVGLTFGKTMLFDSGYALDLSLGGYGLAARPSGGADWQLKFGISVFFPG